MLEGFPYWIESIIFVFIFLSIVGFACFWNAFLGAKMINEIGNFPSRSAQIQFACSWKLFLIEMFALLLLVIFYHIFS